MKPLHHAIKALLLLELLQFWPSMAFFRIRINCLDHYQATPTDFDPPLPILHATLPEHFTPGVPVIRVFGATDTGQKACAHIHGAFPYLYIEYDGILTQDAGEGDYPIARITQENVLSTNSEKLYSPATSFHRSCACG